MSEIMVLGSTEGFAGTDSDLTSFTPLPIPSAPVVVSSTPKYQVQASSGGLFSNIGNIIGNVGGWFSQNSQGIVQALDAAGRLRQNAQVNSALVQDAYNRNIINMPPRNWFDEEMFPGMKNSMLALIFGVVVVGGVMMTRKGSAPRVVS